jgi:hypothetical protein
VFKVFVEDNSDIGRPELWFWQEIEQSSIVFIRWWALGDQQQIDYPEWGYYGIQKIQEH